MAGSSAEEIARVVADLRADRIVNLFNFQIDVGQVYFATAEVVDGTRLYHDLTDKPKGVDVYKEYLLNPVWDSALIGYLNQHGNVTVMHSWVCEYSAYTGHRPPWESFADTHTIDWDRVRWIYTITVWLGGHSSGKPIRTCGPLHLWRVAVYPDGEIADVNWVNLDTRPGADIMQWDMSNLVVLGSINLGNCVNVELREPVRQRAAARRIARTGVRVNRGKKGESAVSSSVPLHTVRGHFARYGPQYDRKLLFGKYAGRYWVPQHARGAEEQGRVEHVYEMG